MITLVEVDAAAAEFMPIYVRGEAMGHSREAMRSWPIPFAAVMLGAAGEDDDPVLKGFRQVSLPSEIPDNPDGPKLPRRGRRSRLRGIPAKVFRGEAAR